MRLRLTVLAALSLVAALSACQDAYAPKANYLVSIDTTRVSALSGTPIQARSAVHLLSLAVNAPGPSEFFDFALDIAPDGKVLVIPRAKVLTCTSSCQLGLSIQPIRFDSLYDAPERGYVYDSTLAVVPGQTVAMVTKEIGCYPSNIATYDLYAKMIVDSVRLSDRSIFVRLVSDPNCGFRGLVPGTLPRH